MTTETSTQAKTATDKPEQKSESRPDKPKPSAPVRAPRRGGGFFLLLLLWLLLAAALVSRDYWRGTANTLLAPFLAPVFGAVSGSVSSADMTEIRQEQQKLAAENILLKQYLEQATTEWEALSFRQEDRDRLSALLRDFAGLTNRLEANQTRIELQQEQIRSLELLKDAPDQDITVLEQSLGGRLTALEEIFADGRWSGGRVQQEVSDRQSALLRSQLAYNRLYGLWAFGLPYAEALASFRGGLEEADRIDLGAVLAKLEAQADTGVMTARVWRKEALEYLGRQSQSVDVAGVIAGEAADDRWYSGVVRQLFDVVKVTRPIEIGDTRTEALVTALEGYADRPEAATLLAAAHHRAELETSIREIRVWLDRRWQGGF